MVEFRGLKFSNAQIAQLDFVVSTMGLHEAMELCGTAPQQLTEPRPMDDTERSTLSGMLDGLSITPRPAVVEGLEKLVLPGKIISLGGIIINPVDADVPIAAAGLQGLKDLRFSYFVLTAVGPSMEPDDAISLRDCPLKFHGPGGRIVEPELTAAGNYRFALTPNQCWTLKYGS